MWQITQKFLNVCFTNVIIQKIIKTKFISNYKTYVIMKIKMPIMQHKTYIFIKKWFGNSLWKIKNHSLEKTKLNFSVIVINESQQSRFIFNFSYCDWKVSSMTHIWNNLTLIFMKYFFAILLYEMGPWGPTEGNTRLIRPITFLWHKSN